jgi:hypothetical protein
MASKAQGSYNITIKAIDATTTVVAKINKGLFNQTKIFRDINKSTSSLGREFARFGKITGITYVAKQVSTLGGHIASAAKSTLNFFDKLVSLSGLLTVGGIVAAIRQFSSYSKDLSNNARQIGITPKALQSWQKIGEFAAGISPETMTANLQGLSKTIEDAIFGRDNEARDYLLHMGIQLTDVNGEAKDAGTMLDELIGKFNKMPEGAGKAAAKMELMAKMHLGADMEPLLHTSPKDLAEAKKEAAKYNNITEAGIAIGERYRKSMVGVSFAVKDLSNAVGEALAPAFTELLQTMEPMVKSWGDWIRLHQNDIIKTTTGWVKDFVIWLKQIDFGALLTGLEEFGKWLLKLSFKDMTDSLKKLWKSIDKIVQGFGGWEKVGFAAIALGIGLIVAKVSNVATLAALGTWIAFMLAYNAYHDVAHQEHITDEQKAQSMAEREGMTREEVSGQYQDKEGKWHSPDELARRYDSEHGPGSPPRPSSKEETAAAADSFKFWMSKGLSPAEAASMAAQEISESGGDPNARGDKDAQGVYQAHGAYQWHPERRALILKNRGIDVDTANIEQQREAAYWEYTHNLSQAAKRIKEAGPTPYQKGVAATGFEGPLDPDGSVARKRGDLSEKIYNENYSTLKDKHDTTAEPTPTEIQKQKALEAAKAKVDVSFNGFPTGLFSTQSSSSNMALNTSRTAGPIFAG